jgi:hypothetical protein
MNSPNLVTLIASEFRHLVAAGSCALVVAGAPLDADDLRDAVSRDDPFRIFERILGGAAGHAQRKIVLQSLRKTGASFLKQSRRPRQRPGAN